jgi:hypothetical protein
MWANEKGMVVASRIKAGVLIYPGNFSVFNPACSYILSSNPRQVFQMILDEFYVTKNEAIIGKRLSHS